MKRGTLDITAPWRVFALGDLLKERVRETPHSVAYHQYDESLAVWYTMTWAEVAREAGRWQAAMAREGLQPGDRVAIQMRNRWEWVAVDMAALGLGLVVVPLYSHDRAENVVYMLKNSEARLLVIDDTASLTALQPYRSELGSALRIVALLNTEPESGGEVILARQWLPEAAHSFQQTVRDGYQLATLIYTSGTTGRPKGVMLSHRNLLADAFNALRYVPAYREDLFLSFLPLSHALERTAGYYLPMMAGSQVAYARSIATLGEDLVTLRPTVLISVPRIYERIHAEVEKRLQGASWAMRQLVALAQVIGWRRFLSQQGKGSGLLGNLLWPLLDPLVARR
ncbi:MAG: AMP-binding protein, partial [Magnetococcales bacterium]|nr:AMP-binding protein [Magnetococcales bacterium]